MGRKTADNAAKVGRLMVAAEQVFLRSGYDRTTIGMLAEASGMSRPAVYLLFPGKAEIFAALVKRLNDRMLTAIAEELSHLHGFGDRLRYVCRHWNNAVFTVHAAHPEARDMDDLSFDAVRALYEDLAALLAVVLRDGAAREPVAASRALAFAARGCRIAARERDDMIEMIDMLVTATVEAVAAPRRA